MTRAPLRMQVRDLACARGGVPLLDGVSFGLEAGAVLVLRGPNGCGKTTLLRTLAGLQPALSGDVTMPEESLVYAAHADGVKPTLTVVENLQFWARIHGAAPDDSVDSALERMNLRALSTRQAQHLSAGQKRRLGLARLLVSGRPLWMLDEPTVSLDAQSVAVFAELVRRHLAQGGAALIATHVALGLEEARELDLGAYRAALPQMAGADNFDEAFL